MASEQELNKKLAEWAGFKLEEKVIPDYWMPPVGDIGSWSLPHFTQSLDACFKWLVPKLKRWRMANYPSGKMSEAGLVRVFVTTGDWNGMAENEAPALALCKAIERLIDA